ncbi:hypothetical protein GCM10009415_16780 [Chitinophaga japonensis]
MHTDIPETTFLSHISKLLLPIGPEAFIGAACANTFIEHGVKRARCPVEVNVDYPSGNGRVVPVGSLGNQFPGNGRKQEHPQ